ncbi:DUF2231 domain-containing protein [Vreelandella populi]|uniref:DUF2231 domain-containing protein n=1 Tax=Vreelandella populi TaxID=2498858 RepID=UPI000F8EBF60|nr:DUF2231 domain-containing protein [Halomonas populi]RUR53063.1 hypothetical protein ELY40_13630 [Halomonas populi]
MSRSAPTTYLSGIHPLHALLLASTFPLFLGATLSDYAYSQNFHIQWSTFSSWLIAGGLVFAGLAFLCAIIGLFRADHRRGLVLVYPLLLLVIWVLGFINALVHARDAWAMMPTGLILSIIVTVLTVAAIWIGFSRRTVGATS